MEGLQTKTNIMNYTIHALTATVARFWHILYTTEQEYLHEFKCRRMATVYLRKSSWQRERHIDVLLDEGHYYQLQCLMNGLEQYHCLAEIAFINRRMYGQEQRI